MDRIVEVFNKGYCEINMIDSLIVLIPIVVIFSVISWLLSKLTTK